MMIKELWILYQFKTGMTSPLNTEDLATIDNILDITLFFDFDRMKEYSAEKSAIYKKEYPDYCSTYDKFVVD